MANITSQDYLNHRMMTFTPDVPFEPDPWVKVGTTTIDGDRPQVASALGLEVLGLDAVLGYIITDRRVLHVGGRNIIPVQWECNDYGGMVHCDIVRRQSEIEAERWVASARKAEPHEMITPPTCPECGPHGNRGEVLLASSWAKCTTCAGGKPGDLWGEVKVEEPLFICGVDVNSKPTYDEVRTALATTIKGLQVYSEGERVVDRWGRTGVVVPADESWPKSVRVRMDAGWTGIFSLMEIAGKADL